MAVNKVIYDGDTLVDLTGDSVTPETLAKGVTAHAANGEPITGLLPVASITNVTESNADDGTNIVTFSDGTKLNIKNGNKGSDGDIGFYIKATVDRPSFTEANWTAYGEIGHSENWGNTDNAGFRDGDLFIIAGTSTDAGKGHMLIYRFYNDTGSRKTLYGECIGHHIISAKGAPGAAGTSVTVSSVTESSASLGLNYVTFSDGKILTVRNGKDGTNGKTPVKGTDYFTEADKAEIVRMVIETLGGYPIYCYMDDDKNIFLKGCLIEGEGYSLKYENEDGSTTDIINFVFGEGEEEIINQIRNSVNADGTPYGTNGYQSDTRIDSSTGNEVTKTGHRATGFIPVTSADKVYIKGITYTDEDKPRFAVYDSSKTNLASSSFAATGYGWASESNGVWTIDVKTLKSSGVAFFRFSAIGFTDETIATVNQPLT